MLSWITFDIRQKNTLNYQLRHANETPNKAKTAVHDSLPDRFTIYVFSVLFLFTTSDTYDFITKM